MSALPAAKMLPDALRQALLDAQAQVNTLVLGKAQEVRLAFVALLSDGHLLIEDLPGLGKTTLAHALAAGSADIGFLLAFGRRCDGVYEGDGGCGTNMTQCAPSARS